MASSVVVKVKYGDTLRRFNVPLNENQQMEFDIEGLRAKIRSLFNFTADAELSLTYVDEDFDMVALVDEEDLRDVVRQALNPVRITVQLSTGKAVSVRSSGSSTPVRPPPAPEGRSSSQNMNAGVAEFLKSVPEPLWEPLSKLSADVTSKAATTSPVLAELIDSFTKLGHSFLNANHPPQSGQPDVAATKETPGGQNASMSGKDAPAASGNERSSGAKWNVKDINECKRKLGGSVTFPAVGSQEEGTSSAEGIVNNDAPRMNKIPFAHSTEDRNMRSFNECPFAAPLRMLPSAQKAKSTTNGDGNEGSIFHRGVRCDGCGVLPITGPRFKSRVKNDYDLCRICFEQMGTDADYIRIDFPAPYRHPWSFKGNPLMQPQQWAYHTAPSFSQTPPHLRRHQPKLDSRFILDVNVMDGTVMAPNTPFTKIWRMRNSGNLPWTHGTQLVWIGGDKISPTDSVEIEVPVAGFYPENEIDVAVDFVSPALPGRYISYWKMASPTGHKFGQRIWVLVQVDTSLSDAACTVTNRLNLNLPPEGTRENLPENLNVEPLVDMQSESPPVALNTNTVMQKQMVDEQQNNNLSFPDDMLYNPFNFGSASSSSAPPVPATPMINEPVVPAAQVNYSPVTYPTLQDAIMSAPAFSAGMTVEPVGVAPTQVDVPIQTEAPNSDVEEVLLKELADMGFKMVSLNKEVLRKNDYNFEQSLDELCNVNEWDLLLDELQGMGFADREMNKKVLEKNNGSLKHAVMELITREEKASKKNA